MNVKTIRNIQVPGIHFVGAKMIKLVQKDFIGFMKEMDSLLMSTIFISKKKLFKIVLIVSQTMFQSIQATSLVQTEKNLIHIKL